MTHFEKGDLLFIGIPGSLSVREVYQNPPITGDPLNGASVDTKTEMDSLLLSDSFEMNHSIDPYRRG